MIIQIKGSPANISRWLGKRGIKTISPKRFTGDIAKKLLLFQLNVENDSFYEVNENMGVKRWAGPVFNGNVGLKSAERQVDPNDKLWVKGIANANVIDWYEERLDPFGLVRNVFDANPVYLADHMYWTRAAIGQVPTLSPQEDGVHFEGWI